MSESALDALYRQFYEIKALPPDTGFRIKLSDTEATDAAREYLFRNKDVVSQMIKSAAKVSLDVSDPQITFRTDEIFASARGGKGFMKVNASICSEVRWDGSLHVNVKSVDVPFVKTSPAQLNSLIQLPLQAFMRQIEQYGAIRSFNIMNGFAVLSGLKK